MNTNGRHVILLLVLIALLVGCMKADLSSTRPSPARPTTTPTSFTASENFVQTPTSGLVITPTVSARAPSTPTFTSTVPRTGTFTPIPTMTVTPMVSLSAIESQKMFANLLIDNGGCLFPCWFGFTPGLSSYSEVENYLRSFTTRNGVSIFANDRTFTFSFHNPSNLHIKRTLGGEIHSKTSGSFQRAYFEAPTASYPVSRVLSQYGPPDEIRLSALGEYMALSEKGTFWIVLFYPEKGIMVEYEGYMEKAQTLDICLSPNQLRAYSRILLWDPTLKYSFTKAGSLMPLHTKGFDSEQDIQRDYHPINEVSKLDIQSLYEKYRQDANQGDCFQVPDLDWSIDK